MKITGLDQFSKTLDDAQKALSAIDGDLGSVQFDPYDPASIEAAVQEMESMIDERLTPYEDNAIISPMIEGMKEKYRDAIIQRAAEARLSSEDKSIEDESTIKDSADG